MVKLDFIWKNSHSTIFLPIAVPPNIAELKNLEVLNFFNNQIEELPTQISSLQKLKHLNLGWVLEEGEGNKFEVVRSVGCGLGRDDIYIIA
jgi:hypothetical protein